MNEVYSSLSVLENNKLLETINRKLWAYSLSAS